MRNYSKIIGIILMLGILFSCSEDSVDAIQNGTITGKVVTSGDFTPIENAKVTVSSTNASVFTDANGDFMFENATVGSQSVTAEKEGFITAFEGAEVPSGGTVNVVFELDISTAANRPPNEPVLITPEDNSVDQEIELELVWSASDPDEDVLTYKVEIRNDENADVTLFEDLADTTLAITGLDYGVKYFWQVSANDNINAEVWSMVSSFETRSDPEHRFLFVRNINGNDVIFSGAETSDVNIELQLTSEATNSWRPRKNVNNGLVGFLRTVGSETHLFSMLPDGSEIFQITGAVPVAGFDLGEIDFCWSANGEELLFTNFDKLYKINKDGSGLVLLYQTVDGSFITECDWSVDGTMIALKTNNLNGYGVSIFTIDMTGTLLVDVLSGVNGAAGGINFSVDNNLLLYSYDISGFESPDYRQLDTHLFIYNFSTMVVTDVSTSKPAGFLDLDPRFSPNEAEVIFTNTSNDGLSVRKVMRVDLTSVSDRVEIFNNAEMPDWE